MTWLHGRLYFRELALICAVAILPGDAFLYAQAAQPGQASGNQQAQFISPEQLDSLVAPIALYPDPLLAQVLAASTYPLEIVTADRWVRENSNLKDQALLQAAGKQDWDPSVHALVAFPSVLQMLNQNLDWTTSLGNAFLAQQSDVMSAVQRMRMKAQQTGKLQSTPQQQVQTTTLEGQPTIVIQPANPEVIYVPSYDPALVFGAAPAYYPYPSVAYPTGAAVAAGIISFGAGVAVGALFNGCCGAGWGWGAAWGPRPSLYVNNNFFAHNANTFVNRRNWGNAYAGNGRANWNHNPRYRGAVPYPNRGVANRFNGAEQGGLRPAQMPANIGNIKPPSPQVGQGALKGNIGANRPAGGISPGQLPGNIGAANRPGGRGAAGQLPANIGANRPGGGQMPKSTGSATRISPGAGQWGGWSGSRPSPVNRGGAFAGGSAGQARQFSNRGARSMGGGGSRGGGRRR